MKIFMMFLLLMCVTFSHASTFSGHCQSKLRVHKELPNGGVNILSLDIAIEFIDNGKMLFYIEGTTFANGSKYSLSRYINYDYQKKGEDFYEMKRTSTELLHPDNYPGDSFMDEFGIEVERPKIYISKIYNEYVFANQFSPVFICMTS